ncbi:MAG: hypothetical protein RSB70_00160 [Clostridium sp.]
MALTIKEPKKDKIKKSRSLTKNEVTLLTAFFVFGSLYVSINYIYAPKNEEIAIVQDNLDKRTIYYEAILEDFNNMDKLKSRVKALEYQLDGIRDQLTTFISQENIVLTLDGMVKESGIKLNNISLGAVENMDVEGYFKTLKGNVEVPPSNEDAAAKEEPKEEPKEGVPPVVKEVDNIGKIAKKSVQLDFEGSVSKIYDFLGRIEDNTERIHVTNISLTELENNGKKELSGSITIEYISYAGAEDKDTYNLDVPDYDTKPNLFYGEGWDDEDISKDVDSPNFTLTLPASSEEPIIFGAGTSESSKKYLNATAQSVEGKLQIEGKEGTYAYNYGLDSLIIAEESKFVIKDDKLLLLINSRSTKNNTTKIILDIENNSDKELEVKILNNSEYKPLIEIRERKGKIQIKTVK